MHTIDYIAEMGKRIEAKLVAGSEKSFNELVTETAGELRVEESLRKEGA